MLGNIWRGKSFHLGLASLLAVLMAVAGSCALPGEFAAEDEDITDEVQLLDFPPPYSAMLAISNDIDGTTLEEFREIHRFINTEEQTRMGRGVGLDFANSFWFFNFNDTDAHIDAEETATVRDQLSYFRPGEAEESEVAAEIRHYIRAGWIDTLHSWGDFSRADVEEPVFRREHAHQAIAELKAHDLQVRVWSNHGNKANIQNFGLGEGFAEYQEGDVPDSSGYHTDLTLQHGIQFVWNSQGSAEVGGEELIFPIELRDGRTVWGFDRYTHTVSDGEIDWLWGVHDLHHQLSEENLREIADRGWYSIVANHLGNRLADDTLPDSAVGALQRLRRHQDEGDILVARTSRLLQYHRVRDHVHYTARRDADDVVHIDIDSVDDPVLGRSVPGAGEIRGLTFALPDDSAARIYLDGEELPEDMVVRREDGDEVSVGVEWFAPDHRDYTREFAP